MYITGQRGHFRVRGVLKPGHRSQAEALSFKGSLL